MLIVDETHHLRTELLEDLRLLTNYAMDSENRLIVVLVGHPELRRRMGIAALDALSQRIVVHANVRGLARDEKDRTPRSAPSKTKRGNDAGPRPPPTPRAAVGSQSSLAVTCALTTFRRVVVSAAGIEAPVHIDASLQPNARPDQQRNRR